MPANLFFQNVNHWDNKNPPWPPFPPLLFQKGELKGDFKKGESCKETPGYLIRGVVQENTWINKKRES